MPRKAINSPRLEAPEPFVGTKEAAMILGVSISTVQKLVDSGAINAWRTDGGHRRLSLASVQVAAKRMGAASGDVVVGSPRERGGKLRILVVDGHAVSGKAMVKTLAPYESRAEIAYASDAAQALLKCSEFRPDLIITDLVTEPMDGFHLISAIRTSPHQGNVRFLVITGMAQKDIDAKGGLGDDVTVYRKPLPADRLAGFLDGLLLRT